MILRRVLLPDCPGPRITTNSFSLTLDTDILEHVDPLRALLDERLADVFADYLGIQCSFPTVLNLPFYTTCDSQNL